MTSPAGKEAPWSHCSTLVTAVTALRSYLDSVSVTPSKYVPMAFRSMHESVCYMKIVEQCVSFL